MQLKQKHHKRLRAISLTPLIDIVFLLLIFFMLGSTFSRFHVLTLKGGQASASQTLKKEDVVFVRILVDGIIELEGQKIQIETLGSELDRLAGNGKTRAILKVENGQIMQQIVKILDSAKRSRISHISLVQ